MTVAELIELLEKTPLDFQVVAAPISFLPATDFDLYLDEQNRRVLIELMKFPQEGWSKLTLAKKGKPLEEGV